MNIIKASLLFLFIAALYHIQAYTISGVVINSGGGSIKGANVRLGKAGISATTDANGSFTLASTAIAATKGSSQALTGASCPIVLGDCKLSFTLLERSDVKVMEYDIYGRFLAAQDEVVSPGNHSIALPRLADGVHIYHVSINNNQYTFKSISWTTANNSPAPLSHVTAGTMLTKTAATTNDFLLVVKEGYQLYRLAIIPHDTSGIQVTLVLLETGMMVDVEGNAYKTIKIGNQEWTSENLRTTKYNDTTNIPLVKDSVAWGSLKTPGYCFYNNSINPDTNRKWGALYNWYAVNTGKLAPKGWHVPITTDWDALEGFLDANGYCYDGSTQSSTIGKAMAAQTDWNTSTIKGAIGNDLKSNNSSGFSALPGGERDYGPFSNKGGHGYWWSTTEFDEADGRSRPFDYYSSTTGNYYGYKRCGYSVRLVRDVK